MLKAIVLRHPQSANLLPQTAFDSDLVEASSIACGTTGVEGADLSEGGDFFPTYAPWNSLLFETSVILTVWEHADQLIGQHDVAFLHSDVVAHYSATELWQRINGALVTGPVGLTAPAIYSGLWDAWEIPTAHRMTPAYDPMMIHAFDVGINIWDRLAELDRDLYDWAMDAQPRLIYSHQFACTRAHFDALGRYLASVVRRLRLSETGFWTSHVFERLIALFLARISAPILTTAFWHYSSSGTIGPGALSTYGARPFRHYRTYSRLLRDTSINEG